jgi:dihydroflavonol-4-reductase
MNSGTSGTVLVTGGSGYLGRWCVRQLLDSGYPVRTTVRSASKIPALRTLFGDSQALSVYAGDLLHDDGWKEAVTGCDYVLHVASPIPPREPEHPDELIVPARDGTLRVLRASFDGGVRRVVVTSSSGAVRNPGTGSPARPLTETDWADPGNPKLGAYPRSKTLAERAAWEYADDHGERDRLTVVNPGTIIGPLLGDHRPYSLQTIDRLLAGSVPAVPRLGFGFVDVRDIADLHVRAMTTPEAAGQRFLAAGPFMWLADVATLLREELGARASRVPRRVAPDALVRLLARFDRSLRPVLGELGQEYAYSTDKARQVLNWEQRPARQSILDCARSILDQPAPA